MMKYLIILALLFSCQPKKYSVNDFFRNVEKRSFQISPEGKHISYLSPYKKRMNIFVQSLDTDKVARITSEEKRDIAGYFWKESRLFFVKDSGGDENYKLYAVNADGTNLQIIVDIPKVRVKILDTLDYISNQIVIGINQRDPKVFDPYRVDIKTGKMSLIMENPGNITGWMFDHAGKLRIGVITDGVNHTYLYRESEKEQFKSIMTVNYKDDFSPLLFTFDNKRLYALSNLGRDKKAAIEYDIKNNKEIRVLFEHKDYDTSNIFFSRKDKELTAIGYKSWKAERSFISEKSKKRFEFLQKELPGYEVHITSGNDNEDKFIVRTINDRSLGNYYLYDESAKKLELLAKLAPWLGSDDMAEMKPIQYQSRDGLTIHGYLTLPKGKKAKNLPFVINPHGGPWHRDVWGYNSQVQFLANRGYGVLQMNFRGSTGYGKKFWSSSFKKWGKEMQNDITDGVNWLIKQGYADPKRIAIYGGSYGGYATLAGITFTPDLYRCAIDYVGVSNIFTLLKTIPPYWKPGIQMLYEMIGDPVKDKKLLEEVSPVFHADKIKVPLFIAQGANDPRVNKAESDQMVEALKKRGIKVDYMVKDNEGHGFHNEENRLEFYKAMEKFLNKHL